MEERTLSDGRNTLRKPIILLVDDEPAIRRLGKRMLEREGFEVIEAEDGTYGTNIFQGHYREDPIVGVLSDVHMPRTSGLEMYLSIQAHVREKGISMPHFIFVSGKAEADDVTISTLRQSERQIVIPKPFDWGLVANAFWGMILRPRTPTT